MAKGLIQSYFSPNTIVFVRPKAPKGGTALGHLLADGCNLAAAILSAGASYYWYRASTVNPPPEVLLGLMGWGTRAEPTKKPNVSVDTRPLVRE
jgi:hypothetical protein